jgi:hypothetical protein
MDKEGQVAILKKLLRLAEQDGVDESLLEAFSTMSKALNNYESIDKEMVARLNDMFSNDLIKKKEYADIIKAIADGSTVVYFKSAQLFKVYKQSELETLLGGQLRTIYKEFNESYELVSNESKQKIVILGDISLADRIESIKTHIIQFMIIEGITNFCDQDIVCYKRGNELEIIINDYYVENKKEHDEIVQKLLNYIFQQEKNTNIVQKINMSNYSEFDGVKMIPMPSDKELIATKYIEPILTMISNVQQCNGFKHITVNLTVNNIDNSTNTTTIHNPDPSNQIYDTIDDFIEHIITDKPKWYTENKWVLFSTIYDNYADYTDDSVTKQLFSGYTHNKLYTRRAQKTINGKRGRSVLLYSYNSLNK